MNTYRYSSIVALLVAIATTAGVIIVSRLPAQTTAGDNPPTITLSVTATSPQTWRPGGRGYYTTTISDDKGLKNVIVTTSQ
ncbi:hypothetical protein HYW11_03705, partial [Candidatus Peregrinibacteria bacterium]|nr:hypothetical protein [Candidatus Peregrinibacteria bacterium]